MTLLLDTCAIIWIAQGAPIAATAINALDEAAQHGDAVFVSPVSAWEIGLLVARRRLSLSMDPEPWFSRFVSTPGVRVLELSVRILISSSFMPGDPPRDPADRFIAASAREAGLVVMTRDRVLLDYARQGHIQALEC
jgi:PIN domain nuclease of toxin-antitoxin system